MPAFARAVPSELGRSDEEIERINTDKYRLSSGALVFSVRVRQHAAGAPATSELLAYIWANSYRDASTLRAHEDRDLSVFDEILHSVRVLPPHV